jgi:tRNA dimethylallyltransferase
VKDKKLTPKSLHIITGPTAIGKTNRSIEVASQFNCPILSFDSRQIYKELSIGVAKPDEIQLNTVQHFFIGSVSIHDDYNAGTYALDARNCINQLFQNHDHLVLCGGTGLYLKALLNGFDPLPEKNNDLRNELKHLLESDGIQTLQNKLKNIDPVLFEKTEIDNPQRLIRAIEISCSENITENKLPNFEYPFQIIHENMDIDRTQLYNRINLRVDQMIEQGLEDEAHSLKVFKDLNALQTVGYSEWWPYFDDRIKKDEVIEKIKQHSRNYAKRQITWFKNQTLLTKENKAVLSIVKQ